MAVDSYHEARSGGKEKPKKMHHLRLHVHKGGHLVTHHAHNEYGGHEEMPYHSEVFSKDQGEELLAHLAKHGKITVPEGEASESEPYEESEKVKAAPERSEADEKGED